MGSFASISRVTVYSFLGSKKLIILHCIVESPCPSHLELSQIPEQSILLKMISTVSRALNYFFPRARVFFFCFTLFVVVKSDQNEIHWFQKMHPQIHCEDIFNEINVPSDFPSNSEQEVAIQGKFGLERIKSPHFQNDSKSDFRNDFETKFDLFLEFYLRHEKTGDILPIRSASFVIPEKVQNVLISSPKKKSYGISAEFLSPSSKFSEAINCSTPLNSLVLIYDAKDGKSEASRAKSKVKMIVENLPPFFVLKIHVKFRLFDGSTIKNLMRFQTPESKSEEINYEKFEDRTNILYEINDLNFQIDEDYLQIASKEANRKNKKSKRDAESNAIENIETKTEKSSEDDEMPPFIPLVSIVYASCAKNYSCFSFPKDCHTNRNCFVHVAFNVFNSDQNSQFLHVVLTANTKTWVAVGFSKDDRMGDDAVVICRRTAFSHNLDIWMATNFENESGKGTKIQKNDDNVMAIAGGFFNGIITCEFNLEMQFTTEKGIKVDFAKEAYFILLAVGQNVGDSNELDKISRHSFSISSLNAEFLGRGKEKHAIIPQTTHNLIVAHVILSVLVYGFFMPSAIIMSRFGQEAFADKICGNRPTWKMLHISFQVLSILCNLINVILICISRFGFGSGFSGSVYHAVFGLLSFSASFVNFGVGISIHVKSKKKPVSFVLKCFHWFIGHLAYFSGVIELIRGAYLKKSWTCCSFSVSAGLSFLFYLGSNIFLMFNTDYLRRKQSIDSSMIRAFLGPTIQLKNETDQDYQVRRWTIIYTMTIFFMSSILLFIELGLTERTCDPTHPDYI